MRKSFLGLLGLLMVLLMGLMTAGLAVATPQEQQQQPPPEEQQQPPEQGQEQEERDAVEELQKREQEPEENESELRKAEEEGVKTGKVPAEIATKEGEGAKKEEKWDVNNPPGPTSEANIDVTEGTWMSVDVSPDGKEIVFDLLGDLYVDPDRRRRGAARSPPASPGTCSRATAPTASASPSPATAAAATTSGSWTATAQNPQQVTKETFRLLNSPAWTPDGEYIVARKHFTSQRSLGAGEMWLYHRSGGEGLQLTKRPNDQKDAGEPAFSPDGRYLYFSQDATPGPIFEYNKDPNGQIYVIQRLDRETGEIERFVDRPRRLDPADAVARRQARSPSSAACATRPCSSSRTSSPARSGRSTTASTATCRRPGPSTASIRDGLDAGLEVARLLGRRQDPPPRRRAAARSRTSRSTSRPRARSQPAVRFPVEVAPEQVRREDAALGRGLAAAATGWSTRPSATSGSATCRTARRGA